MFNEAMFQEILLPSSGDTLVNAVKNSVTF